MYSVLKLIVSVETQLYHQDHAVQFVVRTY